MQLKHIPIQRMIRSGILRGVLCSALVAAGVVCASEGGGRLWAKAMLSQRQQFLRLNRGERKRRLRQVEEVLQRRFPVAWDWLLQDSSRVSNFFEPRSEAAFEHALLKRVLGELTEKPKTLALQYEQLLGEGAPPEDPRWLTLYWQACERRRRERLGPCFRPPLRFVFTKHFNLGGSHYAYTEGLSDAQAERQFVPGSALCLFTLDSLYGSVRVLINDPQGVIRDPDVSGGGDRVLFAWKKSDRQDDYHLYELDLATGTTRQLTFGLGYADYEPAYLPNGDIIFNSTRCVQTVDCWWTEVSNLYTCCGDGTLLRRLSFDQVHTNYPTVLEDGRVIYTRWEYVDRGQIFCQALFQMQPDGTAQSELYGNNSYFPTSILHARGIPGSRKIVAILSGHHTRQAGKLALIDPDRGNQENAGVQLIAPVRETKAVRIDRYGQEGPLFQYPFPLSESQFLVAFTPYGWARRPVRFSIYWVDLSGARELLVRDHRISCNQPVRVAVRKRPHAVAAKVRHGKSYGVCYIQDVYAGEGLTGVKRGEVRRLRVVALRHRPAGIRCNYNAGPAGGALICTPVAIGNGSWNVKVVLGEAKVFEDGSACFKVPARTPVYFQALDERGYLVQSMRSWVTLQEGEHASCRGCHERKHKAPIIGKRPSQALKRGPQELDPFWGPPRAFSFQQEIQPILDRHCVTCHNDPSLPQPHAKGARGAPPSPAQPLSQRAFSLKGDPVPDKQAGRAWSTSYLALTAAAVGDRGAWRGHPNRLVNWIHAQSPPPVLPPRSAGSGASELLALLQNGHGSVRLSRREREIIACWIDLLVPYCGSYTQANLWNAAERERYRRLLKKRRNQEELDRRSRRQLVAGGK